MGQTAEQLELIFKALSEEEHKLFFFISWQIFIPIVKHVVQEFQIQL